MFCVEGSSSAASCIDNNNRIEMRAGESPGTNIIASGRALGKIGALIANGGELHGTRE